MTDKSFTGAALEKALKDGSLTQPQTVLIGMVKGSEQNGYIGFSHSGCDAWVDLPTDMVAQADHMGHQGCLDHSHPIMRITLNEAKSPEGKVLLALLAQSAGNQENLNYQKGSGNSFLINNLTIDMRGITLSFKLCGSIGRGITP